LVGYERENVNRYASTEVNTAGRLKILIMLYEGAIRFMQRAKFCIETRDLAGKGESISKAIAIVGELNNTLDFSAGDGQLAKQLSSLYYFVSENLLKANIKNDSTHVNHALNIMRTLLEGWEGLQNQDLSVLEGNVREKVQAPISNNLFRICI